LLNSEELFASKHRLVLLSEEELRREIERELAEIDEYLAREGHNDKEPASFLLDSSFPLS
jgi:hypothetical protein